MKCIIPGVNIKVFGRAIHSLARIGEELYVDPEASAVSFRTVNSSRSAFASFTFGSGFFSMYDGGTTAAASDSNDDTIKCKVAMKACLAAFKSLATLEKSVEKCKMMLDGEDAKLVIQLSCKHQIVKTFNLAFIECETLQAVYDKSTCSNSLTSQARLWSDTITHFQNNQEEVTLCVTNSKTVIRNHVDDEPDPSKAIKTELTLEVQEFDNYQITDECDLTFCLKEFRAILTFTEPVNLPVTAHFSQPGSPIVFVVSNLPLYEANFVLASLSKDGDSQSSRSQPQNRTAQQNTTAGTNKTTNSTMRGNNTTANASGNISSISTGLIDKRQSISRVTETSFSSANGQNKNNNTALKAAQKPGPNARTSLAPIPQHSNSINRSVRPVDISLPNVSMNKTAMNGSDDEDADTIPGTPPSKKARYLFKRCFESTFNPDTIPGREHILAGDSDSDGES